MSDGIVRCEQYNKHGDRWKQRKPVACVLLLCKVNVFLISEWGFKTCYYGATNWLPTFIGNSPWKNKSCPLTWVFSNAFILFSHRCIKKMKMLHKVFSLRRFWFDFRPFSDRSGAACNPLSKTAHKTTTACFTRGCEHELIIQPWTYSINF